MKPFAETTYFPVHDRILFHGHYCAVCGNGPMPRKHRVVCECGTELHKRTECQERHVCPAKEGKS